MRITLRGFSCAVLLAGMLCSCQKELAQVEQPETEINMVAAEFSAVTEAGIPTRMTLGEGLKPAWEAVDKLAVWDGSLVTAFSVKKAEGSFAKFDGQVAEGSDEYYALFPHTEGIAFDAEAKSFKTVIPSEQIISQGDSVCASALMGMAYAPKPAEGQAQFAFRNVCGLIKVDVPESGKIASIVISSNGEETFVGEGTVSLQEKTEGQLTQTIPVFTPAVGAGKTVTLRPEGENATFEKGSYYAVVAPVEFQTGFSINMVRTDGAAGKISTDQPMKVVRNGGTNLKDIVAISDWKWIITTKEQLLAWNAGDRKKTDYVELGADIDLAGENWEPHDFSGVFEGNGHKIYNISISRDGYCGFVAALHGTIRNLYLGTSDGKIYDGKSEYVYTPGATAGSWVHMGGVAASINNGALIKNVTSFVKIHTPDSDGQAKVCMGGLVSLGNGTNEIQDCVNYGEIVCDASKGVVTGSSNHQLGGIMCKTDGTVTITNCKNYGNISAKGAYVDNVGGIMANPNGNSTNKAVKTHIKGCYNYGNITITKTTSAKTPMALGGIVGKLTGATVEDCHNEGNISSVCDVLTGIGGVAGIHKLDFESKVTACSNGVQNASDKGVLTFDPASGTQQMVIGGILGYSEDYKGKLTLQSCTNYAPISTSYNCMRNIGGVVGAIGKVTNQAGEKSSIELLIDQCHNYGVVTIGGTASISNWQRHIGGIAGMLYGSDTGITVSNCTNNAALSTTATGGGEHRIAGIVGHTKYGNIEVSSCTNNGEIKTTQTAKNPRPAGIISVVNESDKLLLSGCYNKGKILNTSSEGTVFAGGIVAYLIKANITGCHNEGMVEVTNGGGAIKIGGIVGADNATASTISDCVNRGQILYSHSQQPYIGGILGYAGVPTKISDCANEMADAGWAYSVKCQSTHKVMMGGILGFNEAKDVEVSGCTNNGIVVGEHPSSSTNYICVGGICGRINAASAKVTNNTCGTSSHVKLIANTANQLAVAGGIIGGAHTVGVISGNINNGKVTATNASTTKANCVYAGGIFGSDCEGGSGAASVTGNKNYGAVHAAVTGMAATDNTGYFSGTGTGIGAGGLFGGLSKTAAAKIAADNVSYGNVTASNFGTVTGAGALAGVSKVAWSGLVGTSVTVNGEAGAATTPAAGWLCPSGNVTANYVDAPAN